MFVTAFNGARDDYQVPWALNEVNLLQGHVTDFYMPDFLSSLALPGAPGYKGRWSPGLKGARVSIDIHSAIKNILFRRHNYLFESNRDVYLEIEKRISMYARSIADKSNADLFLYSGCAYWAFQDFQRKKIMFQFHPHSNAVFELLEKDFRKYPEVAWSFKTQSDSRDPSLRPLERLNEWKFADKIICASTFTKKSLVGVGFDPDKCFVVPYGTNQQVNMSGYSNFTSGVKGEKCRFLFVGQGLQRKGLHHLLRAWPRVRANDSELVVVSRVMDPGIGELLDQPGVKFYNGLSHEDLAKLYSESDVFVMPSLVEGFGLVYLEALSYGLICIGTSNTGLIDLNLPDFAARLSEPGSVEDLGDVIDICLNEWRRCKFDKLSISNSINDWSWGRFRSGVIDAVTD